MKLTIILLTACCLNVCANGLAQNVSFSGKNVSLESVFSSVKKQTGFLFLYSEPVLKLSKPVSIDANNLPLDQFLAEVFKSQPHLQFEMKGKSILIYSKSTDTSSDHQRNSPGIGEFVPLHAKVFDQDGQPLVRASVTIKKSSTSAITDAQGYFSLNVNEGDILVVTYIGYQSKEITVTSGMLFPDNTFIITLSKANTQLDTAEVVVNTGYQNIPKERATGSFETVTNRQLTQRFTPDILGRLEGLSSIAFDKQSTRGRPPVLIRGFSSIQGSNMPLIIVNNFPFEGDIDRLNPADIESVTILKDAAAASIWGTRAGNGVIVIKTKQGSYNRNLQVNVTSNATITQKPDLSYLKDMTSSEFIDFEKFLFQNGFFNGPENNVFARFALSPVVELLIKQRDGLITNADELIDGFRNRSLRDDMAQQLYQPAFQQQHTVSINGGDQKANYYLSAGFTGNENEVRATNKRITITSDVNYRFSEKLKVNAGLSYIQINTVSGFGPYEQITNAYPYAQLKDDNGNPAGIYYVRAGFVDTVAGGKLLDWKRYMLTDYKHSQKKGSGQNFIGRLSFQYDILKSLSISGNYQYERQNDNNVTLNDLSSYFTRDLINRYSTYNRETGEINYNLPLGAIRDDQHTSLISQNARLQTNFSHNTGDFNINAIGGFEVRDTKTNGSSNRVYGYDPEVLSVSKVDYVHSVPGIINGNPLYIPFVNQLIEKQYHFISFYSNAAVTFRNRYTISGSARRDASNLFGVNTNDKWQPLWSLGGAWNISSEENYNLHFLPLLKLRFTYGYAGNVDLSKSAVTVIRYNVYPSAQSGLPTALIGQYANPELRWEKSRMMNLGLDFSLRENRISGTLEGYLKKGTDLYADVPIDQTAGVGSSITRNAANMKGGGLELNLRSEVFTGVFRWSNQLIANYNTSKVTKFFLASNVGANYVGNGSALSPIEGKPLFSVLTYKWAGLNNKGNPMGIVDGKTTTNYYDIIGEATKPTDLVFGGSAMPKFFGSFINTFGWKNFQLSVNITYKAGYSFLKTSIDYNALAFSTTGSGSIGNNDYSKRWQKPGDELITSVPSLIYPLDNAREAFYNNSEILIRKGDHIRLSYINLSYELPRTLLSSVGLREFKLTASASNLGILWRSNHDGIDPDYIGRAVPPGKSFSIGIQVSL